MELSWKCLERIGRECGDSFYILDVDAFERNFEELSGAFRTHYPNTAIAYSYKTNYTPRLCESVLALGGYAEVVSSLEYELALRIGVPPEQVIFNGPYKTPADLEKALLSGSICNLDSAYEIDIVEDVARRSAGSARMTVGLRCNLNGASGVDSRFGFDVDGGALADAVARVRRIPQCRLGGLHCHSSVRRDLDTYAERARRVVKLSVEHFGDEPPRFINLGGGYMSKMPEGLQRQFSGHAPTFAEYAEVVAAHVAESYGGPSAPQLIIEPGSALTADVMRFAARIVAIKQVGGRSIALASGSIHNIKPTLHGKTLPMAMYGAADNPALRASFEAIDIAGYTCMEHDVLFGAYSGSIGVGDYAVFENVGAYTTVMKPPFIRPAPAIVTSDSSGDGFDLVRRPETASDVFAAYSFRAPTTGGRS